IHYGVFSREWWITIEEDSNNQATMLCPIRIGMKTLVELNGHEFFINVLEPNIEDSPSPTYQASCGLVYKSKIKTIVNGITPTDVWSKIDHKPKFDADELFGTNNSYVQRLINELRAAS
ncbi:11991_t:CDS:2, partial [Gigaspora margarita]